jgi:hypothetical protein
MPFESEYIFVCGWRGEFDIREVHVIVVTVIAPEHDKSTMSTNVSLGSSDQARNRENVVNIP